MICRLSVHTKRRKLQASGSTLPMLSTKDLSPTDSELALQRVAIRNKSKSGLLKDQTSAAVPPDHGSSYEQAKAPLQFGKTARSDMFAPFATG